MAKKNYLKNLIANSKLASKVGLGMLLVAPLFMASSCEKPCDKTDPKSDCYVQPPEPPVDTIPIIPTPTHVNITKTLSGHDVRPFPRNGIDTKENLNVYFSALRRAVAEATGRNEEIDSVILESLGLWGSNEISGGAQIGQTPLSWFVDSLEFFAHSKDLEKTCIIINGLPIDPIAIFRPDSAQLASKYRAIINAYTVVNGK